MEFSLNSIYQKALKAQEKHSYFIDATRRNVSYFLFGKNVSTGSSGTFKDIDIVQSLWQILDDQNNPLSYLIKSFCDEIANSEFITTVTPFPVEEREPYQSYADQLESYLTNLNRLSGRERLLRPLLLELLSYGYFGIYTNGYKIWYLPAANLIPGDPQIVSIQDQPFIVRRTSVPKAFLKNFSLSSESLNSEFIDSLDSLDNVCLLDVWVRPLDLNVCFTEDGKELYRQRFPSPKRYPIEVAKDDELLSSFYPKPLMSYLIHYLSKYQTAVQQIDESSRSLANPLLVYDADSGIDASKLKQALKEGYKRILVGKNREGDINFKTPGALPAYALQQPYYWVDQMMKQLGLTEAFLGAPTRGIRERGALSSIMKTAFRKLGTMVAIMENAFTQVDNYIIKYLANHTLTFKPEETPDLRNIEEIFNGKVRYIAKERFKGFSSEDTMDAKSFALMKYTRKMIPQEIALSELGYSKPRKIVQMLQKETEEAHELAMKLKSASEKPPKTLIEEIFERLKGRLDYRFYLAPLADNKVLVKCRIEDSETVAFLLGDLSSQVLIQYLGKKESPSKEQKLITLQEPVSDITQIGQDEKARPEAEGEMLAPGAAPGVAPGVAPGAAPGVAPGAAPGPMAVKAGASKLKVGPETVGSIPEEEKRGRPPKYPQVTQATQAVQKEEAKTGLPLSLKETLKAMIEARKGVGQVKAGEAKETGKSKEVAKKKGVTLKPLPEAAPHFDESFLRQLVAKRRVIRNPEKYFNLPGLYLVEPHASWVSTGKKVLLVKARKYEIENKPFLLCGKKVYGVIIVRDIVEKFDFKATQKYHLVSEKEAMKWWKNQPLYLYMFEFYPFEHSLDYERPAGVQTFLKEVKIKHTDFGLPQTGDLKPVLLKPFKVPPSHKPEKKAFFSNEIFNIDRLRELIPESAYNVSEKVDGVRCFCWVHGDEVRFYTDEGKELDLRRLTPLVKSLARAFKHTALLDGEIAMEGIERKDVTGYLFSKTEPTEKELDSIRYIVWDILYVKDLSIANKPFLKRMTVLDLYLPYRKTDSPIRRVRSVNVNSRDEVPKAFKEVRSAEGAIIRDLGASYWATHSTYKCKDLFDVDARVFAVDKTKLGLPIFYCELRDGTYIGATYAQAEVKAKPGDVIRVNIEYVTLRPDGSVNWYSPRPASVKEKVSGKRPTLKQPGIGGPDTLALIKEIYLAKGGTIKKWNEWFERHLVWKKDKMPALKESIKRKLGTKVEVPEKK